MFDFPLMSCLSYTDRETAIQFKEGESHTAMSPTHILTRISKDILTFMSSCVENAAVANVRSMLNVQSPKVVMFDGKTNKKHRCARV